MLFCVSDVQPAHPVALVVERQEGNPRDRMPLFFRKRKPSEDSQKRLEYQLCRVRGFHAPLVIQLSLQTLYRGNSLFKI